MKAKFVKENGEILFRDKNGALWSEENIAEVFEMIHKFNQFLSAIQYYRSERTDSKDFYDEDKDDKK